MADGEVVASDSPWRKSCLSSADSFGDDPGDEAGSEQSAEAGLNPTDPKPGATIDFNPVVLASLCSVPDTTVPAEESM